MKIESAAAVDGRRLKHEFLTAPTHDYHLSSMEPLAALYPYCRHTFNTWVQLPQVPHPDVALPGIVAQFAAQAPPPAKGLEYCLVPADPMRPGTVFTPTSGPLQ